MVTELKLIGQPVFLLDSAELEKKLLTAFPEFSSAEIQVQFPNSVNIVVTERIPVLVWNQDGKSALVDSQGITFPNREAGEPGSLPVIEASGNPVFSGQIESTNTNLREQTI